MRARGFTLIEMLLVLALFVALLSLVSPALLHRIAPMTFDRTVEQLESVLLLAREDARRTGAIVYVYAESDEIDGVTRLVSHPTPIGNGSEMGPVSNEAPKVDFDAMGFDEDQGDHLITLPARYRLDHEPPSFEAGEGMFSDFEFDEPEMPPEMKGDPRADMLGFGADSRSTPDLILVCLPDGSLFLPRPTWIIDDDTRAAAIHVDGAIGAIGVVRVVEVQPSRPEDEYADQMFDEQGMPEAAGVLPEARP